MRWRLVSTIAAVVLALVAAAVVWFLTDTTTLTVTVSGLPDDVKGRVTVTGPDGESYKVTGRDEREVAPGEYRVRIDKVRHDGAVNYAAADEVEVTVAAGESTKQDVDYEINVPDTTTVIGDDDEPAVKQVGEDEIVFDRGELAESIDEDGYVVDTDTEDGLLVRKVTKLSERDDTVVAETEKATLPDALPKGVIEIGAGYQEKSYEDESVFELGIGGVQVGKKQDQTNVQGKPTGTSTMCALETPPATFALKKFRINPDVRYTWNAFTGKRTIDTSLGYEAATEFKLAGSIEAKCSVEASSDKFDVGKLCDRGLAKLVRMGPFNIKCDAKIVTKANMSLPTGKVEAKWAQDFTFKASAGVDAKGKPHGGVDSTRNSDASFEAEQKHFTLGLEMGVEVELGAELLETLGFSLIYESTLAAEGSKGEFKVPFKGKVFARFSAEVGDFERFADLQILHWSKELYKYESDKDKDEKKDKSPKPSKVEIAYGEHRDLAVVDDAAATFTAHEGKRLDVDITGGFDETFEVWAYDPNSEMGAEDNAVILGKQCWSAADCAPLILHLPIDYELTPNDPASGTGESLTLEGKFTVENVVVNTEESPTDFLPAAEGTHVSLVPA